MRLVAELLDMKLDIFQGVARAPRTDVAVRRSSLPCGGVDRDYRIKENKTKKDKRQRGKVTIAADDRRPAIGVRTLRRKPVREDQAQRCESGRRRRITYATLYGRRTPGTMIAGYLRAHYRPRS